MLPEKERFHSKLYEVAEITYIFNPLVVVNETLYLSRAKAKLREALKN